MQVCRILFGVSRIAFFWAGVHSPGNILSHCGFNSYVLICSVSSLCQAYIFAAFPKIIMLMLKAQVSRFVQSAG